MRRRSNPWPAFVDLFSALLVFSFAALIMAGDESGDRDVLAARVDSLQNVNDTLAKDLAAARAELRSKARPSCDEVGVTRGFLFDVTIADTGTFVVSGQPYTWPELLGHYRPALEQADSAECVHQVRAFAAHGVSGEEHAAGLASLQRRFYVDVRRRYYDAPSR